MFKYRLNILPLVLLCLQVSYASILSSVDFTASLPISKILFPRNYIGFSYDASQILPKLTNTTFQSILRNSMIYGQWSNTFSHWLHMPRGYIYNCTVVKALNNSNPIDCNVDLVAKDFKFAQKLSNFTINTTRNYGVFLGIDYQNANFTNQDFVFYYIDVIYTSYINSKLITGMQLSHKADLYPASYKYNVRSYINDCVGVTNMLYGVMKIGPGITQKADSSWYQALPEIYEKCGGFSVSGVIFSDPKLLTIQNLLSQKYTSEYIKNRFTINGKNYLQSMTKGFNAFSQIRLIEDPNGVDGLTNSFAAALWAIQFSLQWAIVNGNRIAFFNPQNASKQSIVGFPQQNPSPIYSGLLFTLMGGSDVPIIHKPRTLSGTSGSIKTYFFDYNSVVGFIILNKDTNTQASGEVKVKLPESVSTITCIYLNADSLSSTSAKLGGIQFTKDSSEGVGDFSYKSIQATTPGIFMVGLKYSQAVMCKSVQLANIVGVPRAPQGYVWKEHLLLALYGILLLFVL